MKLEVELLGKYGLYRSHDSDAGWDIALPTDLTLTSGIWRKIPLAVKVRLPKGCCALLMGRSSIWERDLHVRLGLIDNGYRGELATVACYQGRGELKLTAGDRVCQLLVIRYPDLDLSVTDSVGEDTDRGAGGFGSTGRGV